MTTFTYDELSEGQKVGYDKLCDFLQNRTQRTLVIKGYAGTGKSTLIQLIAKEFHGLLQMCFTAPTNKATKVLRDMARQQQAGVTEVSTIHSLLGLKLKPDGSIKVLASSDYKEALYSTDVIVIDECSMVGEELKAHIDEVLDRFEDRNLQIIFMGDPMQLPPIGEKESSTFTDSEVIVELTEVVRQAEDNPIIRLCTSIRESILENRTLFTLRTERAANGHGIFVLPRPKFEQWTKQAYASDAYQTDPNSFKTIAWRNVAVDRSNDLIRAALYPADDKGRIQEFLVGERVIAAAPVQDKFGETILAPTDSEGTIRDRMVIEAHPWLTNLGDFKVYHLKVEFFGMGLHDCYVVHEDAQKEVNRRLKKMSADARKDSSMWRSFWAFKDSFHDIRYAHAVTSHRSQGSTYSTAFVKYNDILSNRNKLESWKSLYVACSRPRENLILLD